jgi:hypothetical protein
MRACWRCWRRASREPLIIILDDAHWLDIETVNALAFVARRIEDESIGVRVGARSSEPFEMPGVPQLRLGGVDLAAAVALVGRAGQPGNRRSGQEQRRPDSESRRRRCACPVSLTRRQAAAGIVAAMTPLSTLARARGAAAATELYLSGWARLCIDAWDCRVPSGVRPVLTLIFCPECDVPADVTERFSLPSTEGPVDHVALACAAGHHFRMPSDMLPAEAQEQLLVHKHVTARPPLTSPCWGS